VHRTATVMSAIVKMQIYDHAVTERHQRMWRGNVFIV
jgi:hypothetical protein